MKTRAFTRCAWALSIGLLACGDATGPEDELTPCTDDTGSVAVSVTSGLTPTFDWSPACGVAMILVEEDGGDVWGASTDQETWGNPASANMIHPPVTYGAALSGATTFEDAAPLLSGHTYEVVLWRAIPSSSTAPCQQRFDGMCLIAVHPFVR